MLGTGFSILTSNTVMAPPVVTTMNNGTNLAGFESVTYDQYDPASGPPTYLYPIHTDTLLEWLVTTNGSRSTRITFSWEAVQPVNPSTGTLDVIPSTITSNYTAYWSAFTSDITRLIALGVKEILICPWQWDGSELNTCYEGQSFTTSQFAYFWGQLSSAINTVTGNSQVVSFDLMNEPHSGTIVGGSGVSSWTPYVQAAINAIRATGATNRIYYEGYNYADSASFTTNGSTTEFLSLTDSANNLAISCHNYNGQGVGQDGVNPGNSNSTTALGDATQSLVTWARSHNIKVGIHEVAIDAGGPNGSFSLAQSQWAAFQTFCLANKDVIRGWNWWNVSEYQWWGTGDSTNGFNWGLNTGSDTTPSIYMNLIQTTLGSY